MSGERESAQDGGRAGASTASRFDDRRDPLRPLRLFALFFRIGALNELQYRANLAVQLFQSAVDILVGSIVLAVAVAQLGTAIGLAAGLTFAATLVLGAVMIYCFWLLVTTAAFWVIRMDEIHELFEGLYQSGRWPVTIYPGWLRISLTFLVPIAFAVTVPAEALTSRLTIETFVLAAAFAAALVLVTRWFFRFGLQNYSGASA